MQIFERHFQLNYSVDVRDGFTLVCLMICIWRVNRVPDPVMQTIFETNSYYRTIFKFRKRKKSKLAVACLRPP